MKSLGGARVLVIVYGVLALAATGRSVYQLFTKFDTAPVAYMLSALAGIVYIVITVALSRGATAIARIAMWFELIGVVAIGAMSYLDAGLFPRDTVWSHFGSGYIWIPLIVPVVGLIALARQGRA
ncbi:MAG: hypothetical protein RLZZ40_857 [Actinomycetota bacterium]